MDIFLYHNLTLKIYKEDKNMYKKQSKHIKLKAASIMVAAAVMIGSCGGLCGIYQAAPSLTVNAAEVKSTSDFDYTVLSDGTLRIDHYKGTSNIMKVPEKINGKTVTQIGTGSLDDRLLYKASEINLDNSDFEQQTHFVTKVVLPDTITRINDYAFYLFAGLKEINIPKNVKYIGESAFDHVYNVSQFIIPASVTYLGPSSFHDNWLKEIYIYNRSLELTGSGLRNDVVVYGYKGSKTEKYVEYMQSDTGHLLLKFVALPEVTLNKTQLSLGKGETFKLTASMAGSGESFQWRTSAPKILTVDQKGNVKAVGTGTAWITAKASKSGTEKSCKITVKPAPTKVDLSKGIVTIGVGEKFTVTSSLNSGAASAKRTYRTSNSSIVKMNKTEWTGEFTGVKPGVAYVTVRTYNGLEKACKVTVRPAPTSVKLTKGVLTLGVGEKYTLGSNLNDGAAAASRIYRTSNSKIVKMTKTNWTGEFIAQSPGVAYVTVRTYNGKEHSCKITVKKKPTELYFKSNVAVMDKGKTFQISPVFADDEYSNKNTYSIADSSVASVSSTGLVKAKKTGTTDVTVKTYNGLTEKVEIIVSGIKDKTTYPNISNVDKLLNNASLKSMKTNNTEIDKLVDGIFAKIIKSNMTKAQKVRACYDYLAQNCTYNLTYPVTLDYYYQYSGDTDIVNLSYPILKAKVGVCDNYSAAFVVMMRRLGFEANLAGGQVGMNAGGYGGHRWVDVILSGKHYIFDPQVEGNNLGANKTVNHYFYGMNAENNSHMYKYRNILRVHNFKVEYNATNKLFKSKMTAKCGNKKLEYSYTLPKGEIFEQVRLYDYLDIDHSDLDIDINNIKPIEFTTKLLSGPDIHSAILQIEYWDENKNENVTKNYTIADNTTNKTNKITWTPPKQSQQYFVNLIVYYASSSAQSGLIGSDLKFDYCTFYSFRVSVY